jgi:hypothetical protein
MTKRILERNSKFYISTLVVAQCEPQYFEFLSIKMLNMKPQILEMERSTNLVISIQLLKNQPQPLQKVIKKG